MKLHQALRLLARPFHGPPSVCSKQTCFIELSLHRMEDRRVLSVAGGESLLFSVGAPMTLPDAGAVEAADIITYDGADFQILFDGSDVGLSGANIDALAVRGPNEFLFSFATATEIEGLGTIGVSDIVLFEADSLGQETAGRFSRFVRGADLGLSSSINIDALDILEDGSLVFSTAQDVTLPAGADGANLLVADEDLVLITPDTSGSYSAGTMVFLFDGSLVGLNFPTEGTDGISLNEMRLRVSTSGSYYIDPQRIGGDGEDILTFTATEFGENTLGSFEGITFNGNIATQGPGFDLNAFDYANLTRPSTPPTAEDVFADVAEDSSVQVQLIGDDADPEAEQTLTYEIVTGPNFGVVTGFDPATGALTYIPFADFHGEDQLTYLVADVDDNGVVLTSNIATVHLTVTAVNDAPFVFLNPSQYTGNEDVPVLIQGIVVGDTEAEAQHRPVQVTLRAANGVLAFEAAATGVEVRGNGTAAVTLVGGIGEINQLLAQGTEFRPNLNFSGQALLDVEIQDDLDAAASLSSRGTVQIDVLSTRQQSNAIRDRVFELLDSRELGRGFAQQLLEAIRQNQGGRHLERAIDRIEQWEASGRLDSSVAQELTERLEDLQQGETTDRRSRLDDLFSHIGQGARNLNRFLRCRR